MIILYSGVTKIVNDYNIVNMTIIILVEIIPKTIFTCSNRLEKPTDQLYNLKLK